ncbi:MAG: hypothetical protein WD939_08010 [Dehalococcoidia bacterium]
MNGSLRFLGLLAGAHDGERLAPGREHLFEHGGGLEADADLVRALGLAKATAQLEEGALAGVSIEPPA